MFCKHNAYTITVDRGYTHLTYMHLMYTHLMYTHLMYTTSTNVSNKIGIPLPPNTPPLQTHLTMSHLTYITFYYKYGHTYTQYIILQLDIFCLFRTKYTITVGGAIRIWRTCIWCTTFDVHNVHLMYTHLTYTTSTINVSNKWTITVGGGLRI